MSPDPDFELHEASLEEDAAHPVRPISWRIIAMGALALAVSLALVATVAPQLASPHAAVALHPTPTATSGVVSSTPTGGLSGLPPGWNDVSPAGTRDIAHEFSDTSVAYLCGVKAKQVFVASSRDGGTGWQNLRTLSTGIDCSLSLDPQHPQRIALFAKLTDTPGDLKCYRSFDGGATWRHETFPAGAVMAEGGIWVGDAFFIFRDAGILGDSTPPRTHLLARSLDGGPFTWVDGDSGFSGTRAIAIASNGVAQGAFYLTLTRGVSQGNFDQVQVVTRDEGQTWHPITFAAAGQALTQVYAPGESEKLVGQTATRLYSSYDNGQSWQVFPAIPPGLKIINLYLAPDGFAVVQFYATGQSDPGLQIYRAHIDDSEWQPVAPLTTDHDLMGIDWDAHGQLTTLYTMDYGNDQVLKAYHIS